MKAIYLLMFLSAIAFVLPSCKETCCDCMDDNGIGIGMKCYKTKSEKSRVESDNNCMMSSYCVDR